MCCNDYGTGRKQNIEDAGGVREVTGLGKSTIYKKLTEGTFPSTHSPGAPGNRVEDAGCILEWLESPERRWDPTEAK